MPAPSLIGLFIAPLNRAGVAYAVTGGLAAIVYGHPRLTLNVDVVLRLGDIESSAFVSLWPPSEFYCPPTDVIDEERSRESHGHFNVIHTESAMRADVYLAGSDPLQEWALAHRVEYEIQGELVQFAPIEYVIVYKLLYAQQGGSDRHLRDIARIFEVNRNEIDPMILDQWVTQYRLADLLARCQAIAGFE